MHQTILQVFLSCLLLSAVSSDYKHRTKRKVVFSKSSKFFFRLNGKDNVLNYTEIFAHGWTFRVNYDLPENIPKRHQFFKRDVHAELTTISDEASLSVYSCILKYVCENVKAVKASDQCGILCGIGKIIGSTDSLEAEFFKTFVSNCDHHINNCPYFMGKTNVGYG